MRNKNFYSKSTRTKIRKAARHLGELLTTVSSEGSTKWNIVKSLMPFDSCSQRIQCIERRRRVWTGLRSPMAEVCTQMAQFPTCIRCHVTFVSSFHVFKDIPWHRINLLQKQHYFIVAKILTHDVLVQCVCVYVREREREPGEPIKSTGTFIFNEETNSERAKKKDT